MNSSINLFGLTTNQMRILFSLEYYIAKQDAEREETLWEILNPFAPLNSEKEKWVKNFKSNISNFMVAQGAEENALITDSSALMSAILEESKQSETSTWKYLILLECLTFSPYYPFTDKDIKDKTYKGLTLNDDCRKDSISTIAAWLDIKPEMVKNMMKTYEDSVKRLTGYWSKVFISIGAVVVATLCLIIPAIGPIATIFATAGLYGAAAVSAGLAALGGGAIAAGGFGMAGGIAVIIGGGVLLGTGAGASIGMMIASTTPSAVMNDCAKMYVILKEIVLGMQHDTQRAQEIISGIIDKIAMLKKEVADLKIQQKKNEEQIKNLEKSIEYLEKFLKYSQQ